MSLQYSPTNANAVSSQQRRRPVRSQMAPYDVDDDDDEEEEDNLDDSSSINQHLSCIRPSHRGNLHSQQSIRQLSQPPPPPPPPPTVSHVHRLKPNARDSQQHHSHHSPLYPPPPQQPQQPPLIQSRLRPTVSTRNHEEEEEVRRPQNNRTNRNTTFTTPIPTASNNTTNTMDPDGVIPLEHQTSVVLTSESQEQPPLSSPHLFMTLERRGGGGGRGNGGPPYFAISAPQMESLSMETTTTTLTSTSKLTHKTKPLPPPPPPTTSTSLLAPLLYNKNGSFARNSVMTNDKRQEREGNSILLLPPPRVSIPSSSHPIQNQNHPRSTNYCTDGQLPTNTDVQHISPISSSVVMQQQQEQEQQRPSSLSDSTKWKKLPPPPSDPPPSHRIRQQQRRIIPSTDITVSVTPAIATTTLHSRDVPPPPPSDPPSNTTRPPNVAATTTATTTTHTTNVAATVPSQSLLGPVIPSTEQHDESSFYFDEDRTPTSSIQGGSSSNNHNNNKDDDGISLTPIKGNRSFLLDMPLSAAAASGGHSSHLDHHPVSSSSSVLSHPPESSYLPRNYYNSNTTTTTLAPLQHRNEMNSNNNISSQNHPTTLPITAEPIPTTSTTLGAGTGHNSHIINNNNNSTKPSASLLKLALSRPFGRESSILPNPQYCWNVDLSSKGRHHPSHNGGKQQYQYGITIHRQEQNPNHDDDMDDLIPTATVSATVWRSYSDCLWLEQALHQEFHGALLVPNLQLLVQQHKSSASYSLPQHPDDPPVDASVLKYWFMDLLNGIRGSGEWILPIVQQQQYPSQNNNDGMVDMIHCESFETFFYRHAIPSTALNDYIATTTNNNQSNEPSKGTVPRSSGIIDHDESTAPGCNTDTPFTLLKSFFNVALSPMEFCVGPQPLVDKSTTTTEHATSNRFHRNLPNVKLPLSVMNCSSRAIGTASDLNIENSIADTNSINSGFTSLSPIGSNDLVIHSELILAEKELALNYVQTSQAALHTLETLLEVENQVGSAWKRFIVSMNNLFAYEKDVENANIGNMKVKRENMPYRKIEKSVVDECLRVMIRQKLDRSVPGLKILATMISAYHADVSSVEASVNTYTKAIQQVLSGKYSTNPPPTHDGSTGTTSTDSSSSSPIPPTNREIQKPIRSWDDLKDWTLRSLQTEQKNRDAGIKFIGNEESKKVLILNERRLRLSLTTMFRTAPFRISRIAWRYWHTEASHCAMINSAAAELRTKLDIVNPSSVSKLLKRHSKDEKVDCTMEMELIQRIVNLGNGKKFPNASDSINDGGSVSTTSINNELVEVDNDDMGEERTRAIKRDKALDIARRRIGRWNAVLAMAILEAVGVEDPNVRVEETTRDLRLVRKYAIGLRECLNRCVEALSLLKEAITGQPTKANNESTPKLLESSHTETTTPTRLKSVRKDFLNDMSLLFSGVIVEDTRSKRSTNEKRSSTISKAVLHGAGIDTTDPSGWIPTTKSVSTSRGTSKGTAFQQNHPARIGNCAVQYVSIRDAHIEWLLSSLDGLFQEYSQRIEVIEGFVYMECVGIQLEKHFSANRAKALSAFEKKTDLTTAANMARKKRMPQLLTELQGKLDKLGPAVSHTTVKETKEAHLESKNVKASLHDLAMRRLLRAQETSTERVVTILDLWAKEEEINATEEIKALGEAMALLEKSVCRDD